ncbi:3060_t:CDS:2 [Entrophospora sp. SA101]|nr:9795_t:CDS:2 [Entrophospora candida]CAG8497283.1 5524_t:CDS:2 [Entrophospora candida]CAH1756315.1 3060_t:CDS:2 [Entrophospora sp. SA101]
MSLLNLEEQLVFYGQYHRNKINVIIHIDHNTLASIVHITSWVLQFIGHGFAEKRSPALKDNIIQAVLLAPLFVWLEVLFAIGYRTVLQKRIKIGVEAAIKRYNENR